MRKPIRITSVCMSANQDPDGTLSSGWLTILVVSVKTIVTVT